MSPSSHKKQRPKPVRSARSAALTILLEIARHQQFADDALDQLLGNTNIESVDRGLVYELVYGILRHRETLDWRVHHVSDRPIARLPLTVTMILRMGVYQLLYLDKIPSSAAVNESVKIARTIGGRDWSGFVNAILRNIIRQPVPSWPDKEEDSVSALSIRYSCPHWLVQRWIGRWGETKTQIICEHALQVPPITLRTNTLRCSRDELATRLRSEGYDVRETLVSPNGLILEKCGTLRDLRALQDGWCYIEDEAAQLIPLLVDVQAHHHVLDVCAAPGGKTTHLSQLMQNHGTIVALDRDAPRVRLLTSNVERLGLTNVTTMCTDVVHQTFEPNTASVQNVGQDLPHCFLAPSFDRILVDAPCSGLGVLRRHPEGKWMKGADLIHQSAILQVKILEQASTLLRPGGVLVYSACSTEQEETHDVVRTFLAQRPEFSQESVEPWIPPAAQPFVDETGCLLTLFNDVSMDGFFAARFVKEGHAS